MAFLGRERELAQLAEAVRRVAEGRLGHVVLTGPAGIGCTRLLDELSMRVSSVPGVLACRGRAYEPAQGMPYQAVGEALASAFRSLPDERVAAVVGNAAADLCAVVPGLDERLDSLAIGRDPPELEAPDLVGRRVLESLLGVLERIADGGVLLLILEDLHQADPATRKLIEALQYVGRSLPVCLVVTYQPEEVHRRHAMQTLATKLHADPETTQVELGPLEAAHIEALTAEVLGEQPARNFEQLYGARLQALSADAIRAVRVLATAGVPLLPATLLKLRAPGGRLTVMGLDDARAAGFINERGERLAISHELCAEAVERISLTHERQALHAAIAEQLQAEPALAAWHWERAARPAEARAAHERAALMARVVRPRFVELATIARQDGRGWATRYTLPTVDETWYRSY